MLQYIQKDLLSVERGVIAHGCNYVGVMGAGVALLVQRKYPHAYREYMRLIGNVKATGRSESSLLGEAQFVFVGDILLDNELFIANCFTQGLERFDGQLATPDAIRSSLKLAIQFANGKKLPLYLPEIGAGLGGLDWEKDVEPIVKELATEYPDVDTYVCVYP